MSDPIDSGSKDANSNQGKGKTPKSNAKPMSEKARVALWSIAIPAVCGVLAALIGTLGTIAGKSSDLKSISAEIPGIQKNLDDAKTQSALTLSSTMGLSVPAGTILPYGGPVTGANEQALIQSGWLPCDGREVHRETNKVLFNKIGISWGEGNRVDTFNLPDLRGVFLRGVTGNRSDDYRDADSLSRTNLKPGANDKNQVGSFQLDSLKAHSHKYVDSHNKPEKSDNAKDRTVGSDSQTNITRQTAFTGGGETRPKNAYVHYIIKY